MSKKQTAVEILHKSLELYGNPDELVILWDELDILVKQALQLEREQIGEAFDEGNPNGFIDKNGEQYYTQTYGKCTPQSQP